MSKLILLRHAEVQYDRNRFLGKKDVSISSEGKEHAKKVADKLKHEKIDVIYSSELKRSIQTADIVAQALDMKVNAHMPGLNEMNFGVIEGLTKEEATKKYPKMMIKRNGIKNHSEEERMNFRVDGAETYNECGKRALETVRKIMKENEGKNVLIVTHHHIIRILAKLITGKSLDEIEKNKMDYCCRFVFEANSNELVLKKILD